MSGPSIVVGGGGKGARGPPSNVPSRSQEGSLSEQVGKMAEESREHQQNDAGQGGQKDSSELKEHEHIRQEQQPRNPKKRMWNENVEAEKYEQQKKDEL